MLMPNKMDEKEKNLNEFLAKFPFPERQTEANRRTDGKF